MRLLVAILLLVLASLWAEQSIERARDGDWLLASGLVAGAAALTLLAIHVAIT